MSKLKIEFNNMPGREYDSDKYRITSSGEGHWLNVVRKADNEEIFCVPTANVFYVEVIE